MQFDKDTLIKQRYWVLAALFLILWLVCVVLVKTSAAGEGEAKHEAYKKSKDGIEGAKSKSPKNAEFNKPWDEYGKTYRGMKEKVWGDAWEVQKHMSDWPSSATAQLNRLQYPSDDIPYLQRSEYYRDLWREQLDSFEKKLNLAPVEFNGGSAGYERMMLPIITTARAAAGAAPSVAAVLAGGPAPAASSAFASFWKGVPTKEEMWLAQEDFWVKRELLGVIKDAVDSVARFRPVVDKDPLPEGAAAAGGVAAAAAVTAALSLPTVRKAPEPLPEGIAQRARFRNNLWEVELLIEQQPGRRQATISDRSTIKNLHPAQRVVPLAAGPNSGGLRFKLVQGNNTTPFRIDGEPLGYGQSAPFRKKWLVDSIDFKKPFDLEQVFEWANSPIKVIVDLRLGYPSHRTAKMRWLPSLVRKPDAEEGGADAGKAGKGAAPGPPGGPPPPATAGMPTAPGGPAGVPGAAAENNDLTPVNGLDRNRYVFVTEQVRHLPIALHLVVDQTHIHEVLVALSNSRLRVQTTQVQFRHVRGIRSSIAEPGAAAPPPTSTTPSSEDDPNLVELAVYGLASLYERFPPKAPAAAGTPGAPSAAPAAGAPTALPKKP